MISKMMYFTLHLTALPILGTISPAQPKLDDAAGVSQAPAPGPRLHVFNFYII